jgi:hypothetical protein
VIARLSGMSVDDIRKGRPRSSSRTVRSTTVPTTPDAAQVSGTGKVSDEPYPE